VLARHAAGSQGDVAQRIGPSTMCGAAHTTIIGLPRRWSSSCLPKQRVIKLIGRRRYSLSVLAAADRARQLAARLVAAADPHRGLVAATRRPLRAPRAASLVLASATPSSRPGTDPSSVRGGEVIYRLERLAGERVVAPR